MSEICENLTEHLTEITAEILAESVTDAFLLVSTSISTSHLSPGVDLHFSPGVDLHFSSGVDLFFGQSPSSPFTKFSVVRLNIFDESRFLELINSNNLTTENLVNGELGDWPKNRSTPGEKWRSTPGEKWRSTPGDKWEVEMEVDTMKKASVTLSDKISAAMFAEFPPTIPPKRPPSFDINSKKNM